MSRRYIDIQRIIDVQTKLDQNGISYLSVTIKDSRSGDEITLRMTVNQAKILGEKIVEAEEKAVKMLKQAGYKEWPTRFILPDYPSSTESRSDS